uniref:WD-40 repeat protein n=1 Tax=Cyanothece sp. (strain PCC 7425 / ATCC 29141) TaxID=395961 RepID=B8HXM0_CYAP4
MAEFHYQVGGSLINDAPSYITRQADTDLYAALKRGEFCYVLNSRQMGKSSLLVRTRYRLQQEGYGCAVLDMTTIGSENITPLQWYKGIVKDLWRNFKPLRKFDLQGWWRDEEDVSLLQRLSYFFRDVLLTHLPEQPIVIFIDEIDSILTLPFAVDDFFALIRFCYNQRAVDAEYQRLSFAIFGVATPSDLIRDRKRTPFNLGTAIALNGFTLQEALPLTTGLRLSGGHAENVMQAILDWTNGQPFLTQKLCQLVISSSRDAVSGMLTLPPGNEAYWVESLVRERMINEWEAQDEPEHLRTIRNRILSQQETAGRFLGIYQQILQSSGQETALEESIPPVATDDSPEQTELLLSGLVIKQDGWLRVKNRVYAEVFNLTWVEAQLVQLRPYAAALKEWVQGGRADESRLLRGQALQQAQLWSQGKRLSDLDYQFLAASVECDRKQVQQAMEADRLKVVEALLHEEQKAIKLQRRLLIASSFALLVALGFGTLTFWQFRQARLSEIHALVSSAAGNFDSHRQLEAIIHAIRAETLQSSLIRAEPKLQEQGKAVLRQVILGADEINRLDIGAGAWDVAVSPDGQLLGVAALDGTVQLWRPNGQRVATLRGHQAAVHAVDFSPDGRLLATGSTDQTVKLWRVDGTLLKTLTRHQARVHTVKFSPDGQRLASIDSDQKAYLWNTTQPASQLGRLIQPLPNCNYLAFSPDRRWIVASFGPARRFRDPPREIQLKRPKDNNTETTEPPLPANVRLLTAEGRLVREFATERGPIFALSFSPDSRLIATASVDGPVNLWQLDGSLGKTFIGHRSNVRTIAFSPDGQWLATAGTDQDIRLWQTEGGWLKTFAGHQATVWNVVFSPAGQWLASASEDGTVRLWKPRQPLWDVLAGHTDTVNNLLFTPEFNQLLSLSVDRRLNIWQEDSGDNFQAVPVQSIVTSPLSVRGLALSNQGDVIAIAYQSGQIELRRRNGSLVQTLEANGGIRGVAFSPDGRQVISGGSNGTVKLWRRDKLGRFPRHPDQSLVGHQTAVYAVSFNPQGNLIASGSADQTIKLWRPNGQLFQTLTGHRGAINSVSFSPDGKTLASASSDNTVKLWQPGKDAVKTLEGHDAGVADVKFSPDGRLLASASVDGKVKVWTLAGSLLRTLTGHEGLVQTVAFSPNGRLIASAGVDRRIILWHWNKILQLQELNYACHWIKDYWQSHPDLHQQDRSLCQGIL